MLSEGLGRLSENEQTLLFLAFDFMPNRVSLNCEITSFECVITLFNSL